MHDMTVQDVRLAVGGKWIRRPDAADGTEADDSSRALPVQVGAVCTDTRGLVPGDVFIALHGARFDGAEYLGEAQSRGARCLVAERVPDGFSPTVPMLLVRDSLKALGRLARCYRDSQRACVVGITGSNGKTTTREMASAILKRKFTVLQNTANENNRVGVPKTLLRMSDRHEFAVIEMGTSEPGEIRELARIAGPQCGVLTSISESHLSGLRDLDGVISEKGDLLAELPGDGIAIVNFDDPRCVLASKRANCRVVSYGTDLRCELRADSIRTNKYGTHFMLNGRHEFRLPVHGSHNVLNALASIAIGWVSGVDMCDMQLALRQIEPVGRRLEYHEFGGIGLLDDSYNANPASTCAALRTLGGFPCEGQRIAVLGDMLELGSASERLHREVAWLGTTQPVDLVVAVGPQMKALAEVFNEHFMDSGRGCVWHFDDSEGAARHLLDEVRAGDVVLVKGSNGMRMNRVVDAFRKKYDREALMPLRPTRRERPVGDPLPEMITSARKPAA
ncbi:MAG: UDP-N-acetylmuramoyl-tripeptide--D-alanyl-D-alanine ligase [Planctomycetes bacterium]|nr:UDP-N-acetylmuramoyl-tripeptide--D-alanyl-D-alanine ligase [Planctomycetota bacterium]